jgi:xylulokinase
MGEYLIGIDISTSSCKTIVLNSSGEILDSSINEYKILKPKNGWAEQNPEDWYKAFKNGLKNIFKRNPKIKRNIVAIGLTGQMAGLVLADKNIDILLPAIIWMDQRSMEQVDYLSENFKEDINRITFNPINSSNTLVKIMWIMKYYKDVWKKVYKIQLPKDYIRLKLTNEWYTDYNDASATVLFDVEKLCWSQDIRKLVKIDKSKLSELLPCTEIAGFARSPTNGYDAVLFKTSQT